jgi:ribosomal protein L37AE/L43A
MPMPKKYKSDDERIKAQRAQQNRYSRKKWECDVCGSKVQLGNKSNHFKSEWHIKNLARGAEEGVFENIDNSI